MRLLQTDQTKIQNLLVIFKLIKKYHYKLVRYLARISTIYLPAMKCIFLYKFISHKLGYLGWLRLVVKYFLLLGNAASAMGVVKEVKNVARQQSAQERSKTGQNFNIQHKNDISQIQTSSLPENLDRNVTSPKV